jgi:N-glycosylase/DNA lyase
VKQEDKVVKVEDDGGIQVQDVASATIILDKRIKREMEADEHQVLEVQEKEVKRVKRRRRG